MMAMTVEVNSVFLHSRRLLKFCHQSSGFYYSLNAVLNIISNILFRLIGCLWIIYYSVHNCQKLGLLWSSICVSGATLVLIMSFILLLRCIKVDVFTVNPNKVKLWFRVWFQTQEFIFQQSNIKENKKVVLSLNIRSWQRKIENFAANLRVKWEWNLPLPLASSTLCSAFNPPTPSARRTKPNFRCVSTTPSFSLYRHLMGSLKIPKCNFC